MFLLDNTNLGLIYFGEDERLGRSHDGFYFYFTIRGGSVLFLIEDFEATRPHRTVQTDPGTPFKNL